MLRAVAVALAQMARRLRQAPLARTALAIKVAAAAVAVAALSQLL
jgi:hypothetical protein